MKGIDVSSNNGNINFSQVKAEGVEIVYIKATQGIGYINPYLAEQYQGAKANGLKVGFYHYMDHNDPVSQAQHFLNTIASLEADCKYVIDVEGDWSVNEASTYTRQFADYLIGQGKETAIYTGDYFYRDNLNDSVKDLPLWVANYGGAVMANCYVGLQYSDSGRLAGINGNVDLDNFDNGILIKKEIKEEKEMVGALVVYEKVEDQGAAELLANALHCPVINGNRPYDYSHFNPVICVGATTPGGLAWTGYATKIITGSNGVDTMQKVVDFIKGGCK